MEYKIWDRKFVFRLMGVLKAMIKETFNVSTLQDVLKTMVKETFNTSTLQEVVKF